ncbi:Hypothetical protein, putative [Bodo saltans]|uniref:GYF domain-containing protein n=1 Tax=Bodo saltans TaxID=75058 RepID=A0A0S4JNC5_BODSA|nr:Hypothetical protein, putative [Bodo saltans]|eukprot:CUG90776.1 Hypothetical protein, putative [Bodo saltans]
MTNFASPLFPNSNFKFYCLHHKKKKSRKHCVRQTATPFYLSFILLRLNVDATFSKLELRDDFRFRLLHNSSASKQGFSSIADCLVTISNLLHALCTLCFHCVTTEAMKRPRTEGHDDDARIPEDIDECLGDSSADEGGADDDAQSSKSSSSSDNDNDIGDSIEKEPLGELLLKILLCLLPTETGAAAAGRLSVLQGTAPQAQFGDIVSISLKCTVQHNLDIMTMPREALCRRAKLELLKGGGNTAGGSDLPSMWILQWVADKKQLTHGPFPTDTMKQWKAGGFFQKKPAIISDANDLRQPRVWTDPLKVESL